MSFSRLSALCWNLVSAISKAEQEKLVKEIEEKIANSKETYQIEVTKIGDHSISFESVTRDWPSTSGTAKDPINLVFYNNGNQPAVDNVFLNQAPHNWTMSSGGLQWTFVDETAHGGNAFWSFGYGYKEGSYSDRYHVRIFNGGDDTHTGGFDEWSIGAAHRENCTPSCHTHYSNSWEVSASHPSSDMAASSGVISVGTVNIGNAGTYQGIYNNGIAQLVNVQ